MRRWTPEQKRERRRADHRGCDGTMRSHRRNEARRQGYVWAALERRRLATGQIVVLLPR